MFYVTADDMKGVQINNHEEALRWLQSRKSLPPGIYEFPGGARVEMKPISPGRDITEMEIPVAQFKTLEDVINQVTKTRAAPEHWGLFRLMINGRRVTLVMGVDEGAVHLMQKMDELDQAGSTAIDPRFLKVDG